MAILFALLAYVGWGVGDILGVIYARKVGGYAATFWSYALRVLLFALYIPFTLSNFQHLTLQNATLTIFLSIIFIVGVSLSFEAYRISNASLVGTITASFVIPAVIISVLFLHETLRPPQVLTILVIIVGLFLISFDFDAFKNKTLKLDKGILLSFIVMILWGIYFSFLKLPIQELGWFIPNYAAYLVFPVVLIPMVLEKISLPSPIKKQSFLALLSFTFLSSLGNLGYNLGITKGYVSTVLPIAGSYPTLFVFLSFLIFKDKLKLSQIFGIAISLLGIVAMSFLS